MRFVANLAARVPALLDCIAHVVATRAKEVVVITNAERLVAVMADVLRGLKSPVPELVDPASYTNGWVY